MAGSHAGDVWIGGHLMAVGITAGQAETHLAAGFGLDSLITKGNTCICLPVSITCPVLEGLGRTRGSAA